MEFTQKETDSERQCFNLRQQLGDYLKAKGSLVAPHLPSRVDTSVQGLVIASKSAAMHKALQRIFEKRRIDKVYLLEVEGRIGWEQMTVNEPIGKDPSHAVLRRIDPSGKASTTLFRPVCASEGRLNGEQRQTTILEAHPLTGRTHQIRLHSAALEKPIVGDNFYNGAEAQELHLLSYRFQLQHPFTARTLRVTLPRNFLPEWAIPAADVIEHDRGEDNTDKQE